jgi:hypothetical protein
MAEERPVWLFTGHHGRNRHYIVVFFDFSKAFDLVNHKRLMQKLKKLLPTYLTSWIAEWLSDRKQRVKCGNTYSLWELVVVGVFQGSVLGPILLLL